MSTISLFTARPRPARWQTPVAILFVLATMLGGLIDVVGPASAASDGLIVGRVFEDIDRDGVDDAEEPGWDGIGIQLFPGDGSGVQTVLTDADGRWSFAGLSSGTHRVKVSNISWDPLKLDWVPTTLGAVAPEATVEVGADPVGLPIGVRPIVWAEGLDAPLSQVVADSGLTVRSFTDALSAADVLAALQSGTLLGGEAATTSLNFGYRPYDSSYCSTSVSGSPGSYSNFRAECFVSYQSWLFSRDDALFHEYGHAWANYHDKVVQQDGSYQRYLEARGLLGDERLDTSHSWARGELIAEDFRQLFGSPTASAAPQENDEIPPAADVPGLAEYLSTTFMAAPAPAPTTEPTTEPTTDPTPQPTTEPTAEPTTDPAPKLVALEVASLVASMSAGSAFIDGTVTRSAEVTIEITDHRGRVVARPVAALRVTDDFATTWDLLDGSGRIVKDGDYTVRVAAVDGADNAEATTVLTVGSAGDGASTGGGKGTGRVGPKK